MFLAELKARVETVTALANRVDEALDLAELIRNGALPPASPYAFVLPIGINPNPNPDSAAGDYRQMSSVAYAVVLAVRSAGDPTGKKIDRSLDPLIWEVVEAVCGQGPAEATGTFHLQRGRLLSVQRGLATYQLDFAISLEIRITAS